MLKHKPILTSYIKANDTPLLDKASTIYFRKYSRPPARWGLILRVSPRAQFPNTSVRSDKTPSPHSVGSNLSAPCSVRQACVRSAAGTRGRRGAGDGRKTSDKSSGRLAERGLQPSPARHRLGTLHTCKSLLLLKYLVVTFKYSLGYYIVVKCCLNVFFCLSVWIIMVEIL